MATATASVLARNYDGVRGGALFVYQAEEIDLASIAAGATEDITITATGITSSDMVVSHAINTKDTTLARLTINGAVCSTDAITVTVGNASAGALNAGEVTMTLLVLKAD